MYVATRYMTSQQRMSSAKTYEVTIDERAQTVVENDGRKLGERTVHPRVRVLL